MRLKCPRAKIKQIVKAHDPDIKLKSSVDLLLYIDYEMFLRRLAKEAVKHAKDNKSSVVDVSDIKAVKKAVLKSMRG